MAKCFIYLWSHYCNHFWLLWMWFECNRIVVSAAYSYFSIDDYYFPSRGDLSVSFDFMCCAFMMLYQEFYWFQWLAVGWIVSLSSGPKPYAEYAWQVWSYFHLLRKKKITSMKTAEERHVQTMSNIQGLSFPL